MESNTLRFDKQSEIIDKDTQNAIVLYSDDRGDLYAKGYNAPDTYKCSVVRTDATLLVPVQWAGYDPDASLVEVETQIRNDFRTSWKAIRSVNCLFAKKA